MVTLGDKDNPLTDNPRDTAYHCEYAAFWWSTPSITDVWELWCNVAIMNS